jgi:hypothetical protein
MQCQALEIARHARRIGNGAVSENVCSKTGFGAEFSGQNVVAA